MPMQLYEANHLYLMKIALITKNLQEKKKNRKHQQYIETTRLHLKKKTTTYKRKPVKSIKISH